MAGVLLLGMLTTEMSALNHKQARKSASYCTVDDAETLLIIKVST